MEFIIRIKSSKQEIYVTWTKETENHSDNKSVSDIARDPKASDGIKNPGHSYMVRNLEASDKDKYFSYVSREHHQALTLDPADLNELWHERLKYKEQTLFMVEDLEKQIFCGKITLTRLRFQKNRLEVGAGLLEDYQHQGIMSEILPRVIHEIRICDPDKTYFARVEDSNKNSLRLMEKIGARCIGREKADPASTPSPVNQAVDIHKTLWLYEF